MWRHILTVGSAWCSALWQPCGGNSALWKQRSWCEWECKWSDDQYSAIYRSRDCTRALKTSVTVHGGVEREGHKEGGEVVCSAGFLAWQADTEQLLLSPVIRRGQYS